MGPPGVQEPALLLVLLGDAQRGDGDAVPDDAEPGDEGPHLLRLARGEGDHALVLVRHRDGVYVRWVMMRNGSIVRDWLL